MSSCRATNAKNDTSGELPKGYRYACDAIERVSDTYGLEPCALVGTRTREHLRRAQAEAIHRARGHACTWHDICEAMCITEEEAQALTVEYPLRRAEHTPPGISKRWTSESIAVALAAASRRAKDGV